MTAASFAKFASTSKSRISSSRGQSADGEPGREQVRSLPERERKVDEAEEAGMTRKVRIATSHQTVRFGSDS